MSASRPPTEARPHLSLRRVALAAALVAGLPVVSLGGQPSNVIGSKHDLSMAGGASVRASAESQACVFCHTPHNSSPAPQLWNRPNSSANYTTYGSSTFQSGVSGGTFNTMPGRSASQPAGSARLCLSCHDGTIALGATLNSGTIAMTGGTFIPATASVGTDLSNDHPVSFTRAGTNSEVIDPPPTDAVALETGTRFVQCVSCHDPHSERAGDSVTGKFLVKSNARSGVCVTCHSRGGSGWSWASSLHATSPKTYTAANNGGAAGLGAHSGYTTVADNACEACHRSHSAPQAQRLLKAVNQRDVCFQCHGNAPVAAKNLSTAFAKTYRHPLESSTSTILHDAAEVTGSPTNFSGGRRHVDCSDCHNPHAVAGPIHAAGSNAVVAGSMLSGVAGVEPAAYPAAALTFPMSSAAQGSYALAKPAAREYQICFKCHSSYAFGAAPPTSPSGGTETDAAAEFNPGNRSYHPVVGAPHLRVSAGTNLLAPWNTTTAATRMYCSDCHGNNEAVSATVAAGPHGSNAPYLLTFTNATWSTTAPTLTSPTGLCVNCHNPSTIKSTNRVHNVGSHQSRPCQACHAAVPHGTVRVGLVALTTDPAPYNRGASRVVTFTAASTPSGYQKSSCTTSSGCH
jgi:predicted CXXCH cytochrome family protein